MPFLALDIGTSLGFAVYKNGLITSGTENFSLKDGEGDGIRFIKFKNFLTDAHACCSHEIEAVFFEKFQGAFKRPGGSEVLWGMYAIMAAWCEHRKIPYIGVHPMTLKKWFCGTGKAKKEHMAREAVSRGYSFDNDDEVDAIAVMLWGLENNPQG